MTPEQFLAIADLLPDAALLVSAGGVLAANRAARARLGYAAGELGGRPLAGLVADPPEKLTDYLRACCRSRQPVLGSLTLLDKDGKPSPFRCEGAVAEPAGEGREPLLLLRLVPKSQALQQFLGLNRRIADLSKEVARRQRAEEELRAQREWLHVTLTSIGDAVIATDTRGAVSFLNPVAERLTGWKGEEALGRPLGEVFDIVNEETRAKVDSPVDRVLREGVVVGLANHTVLVGRDRTETPIDDCAAPMRDGQGRLTGAVLVFRDVTGPKRAEAERERLLADLRRANEAKDEFLSMLAHELRNPLGPLRNALHVLEYPGAKAESRSSALAMMDRQVRHLGRLIDDLLDVSRIQRGRVVLQKERLELGRLVRVAVADHRGACDAAGVTLAVDVPDAPTWVSADATRLNQVVANLLHNACKFTPRGGRLDVSLRAGPGEAWASVHFRDTGVGIEADLLPHLFDPFWQADRSLDRSRGGLGLGLALVRGLAEMHGGGVEARSDGPGRGAEFVVRLPTLGEPPAVAEAEAPPPAAGASRRVLVIEDKQDAAESLQLILELSGHEVRLAFDGLEGLRAAAAWMPDAIVSDIGLPGMDGYAVARELRTRPATAGTKLIAVTGYATAEDQRLARESGFDHVLAKPAEPLELLRLLAGD